MSLQHIELQPHGNGKPRFTAIRWEDLPATGLTPGNDCRKLVRSWMQLHDLAAEAHSARLDDSALSWEGFRELVTAASSGLPVEILWQCPRPSPWKPGFDLTTDLCVVSQFLSYSAGTTANLYVRRWGFSHPLTISNIRAVTAPKALYGFEALEGDS